MVKRISVMLLHVFIAICVIGTLSAVHAAEGAEGSPKAFVEAETYNFGTKLEGTNIIHDFIIKNMGDADLVILSVKAA
jgi:hypothetical protein